MIIDRNEYIEQLLAKRWNGKVKIVTGIRRSDEDGVMYVGVIPFLLEDVVAEVIA